MLALLGRGAAADAEADRAALDLLDSLGEAIDERVLGTDRLVVELEGAAIGRVVSTVEAGTCDGRPCYVVRLEVAMELAGAFETSLIATTRVGPDLAPLSVEREESRREGDQRTVRSLTIAAASGDRLTWSERDGPVERTWQIERAAGLLVPGAETVLLRILALARARPGRMTFVEAAEGRLRARTVEVLEEGRRFRIAGDKTVEHVLSPRGRIERTTTADAPLVMSRVPPIDPDLAPPVALVTAYYEALADRDADRLAEVIDLGAIYEWRLAREGAADEPALRRQFVDGYPDRLLATNRGLDPDGVAVLVRPEVWEATPAVEGAVVVRLVPSMRAARESLARIRFVTRPDGGAWRIVRLPGME